MKTPNEKKQPGALPFKNQKNQNKTFLSRRRFLSLLFSLFSLSLPKPPFSLSPSLLYLPACLAFTSRFTAVSHCAHSSQSEAARACWTLAAESQSPAATATPSLATPSTTRAETRGGALPFAMQDFAKHAVGIGGGSLLCVMAVFWMAEREFRKDLKLLLLGGAKEKHD